MKRRKGKTKSEMRKRAKGAVKGNKRSGISMTFNRKHRVTTNPGGRGAFSARKRTHRT